MRRHWWKTSAGWIKPQTLELSDLTRSLLEYWLVLYESSDVALLVSDEARVFAKLPEGQRPSQFDAGTCSADMDTALKPELLAACAGSRQVIKDITDKMGAGMAEYVETSESECLELPTHLVQRQNLQSRSIRDCNLQLLSASHLSFMQVSADLAQGTVDQAAYDRRSGFWSRLQAISS